LGKFRDPKALGSLPNAGFSQPNPSRHSQPLRANLCGSIAKGNLKAIEMRYARWAEREMEHGKAP
jgi:hypothetical protein